MKRKASKPARKPDISTLKSEGDLKLSPHRQQWLELQRRTYHGAGVDWHRGWARTTSRRRIGARGPGRMTVSGAVALRLLDLLP